MATCKIPNSNHFMYARNGAGELVKFVNQTPICVEQIFEQYESIPNYGFNINKKHSKLFNDFITLF